MISIVGERTPDKKSASRSVWSAWFVFFVICLVVGVGSLQYYGRLQSTIRSESSGYLREIAQRTGNNVDRILSDNYGVLNTVSDVIKKTGVSTFEEMYPLLRIQRDSWDYESVMLIDETGKAYSEEGQEIRLEADSGLRTALLAGEHSLSTTQMVNNREYILFATPLENMVIDGIPMVAMAGAYNPASFNEVLSMSAFDGQAYAQIITPTGAVVVRPSAAAPIKTGYNVLNSIATAEMDRDSDLETIREDMAENLSGQAGFTMDGLHMYMVYTPLQQADWYLATLIPASAVNARSDMMLRTTLLLCGVITFLFAGLLAFVYWTFRKHQRQLEHIAFVDEITGGHTIQKFYQLAQEALTAPGRPPYVLVYSNLEKFKVLNEQFGRRSCDAMLEAFHTLVNDNLTGRECIGRISADNFCILLEFDSEEHLTNRFMDWQRSGEAYSQQHNSNWILPVTEFGVFFIENDGMPFPQMIDRAKLSLRNNAHALNSKVRYAIYDDEVRRRMFREKQLEDWMEDALHNREFQVYL